MTTETKNEIVILEQLPVIKHLISEAGIKVKERLSGLELDKQIVTDQTIKTMKVLRAELNKEFEDFENQRKFVKNQLMTPYDEFEELYKPNITEQYKEAKTLLTSKIDEYEFKLKKEKENNVKEYFDELLLAEGIEFLKFENLNLKFDLSTSEKKYKEQVNAFVVKTNEDLALIRTTDYEAEILTEYKKTLNVSNAITTVKTRKESEERETARIKAEQTQNRKNYLVKLGLNYVEITNQYEFNEQIFVSLSDIQELSKEDFTAKYAEIEIAVKNEKAKEIEVFTEEPQQENKPEVKQTDSAPLQAPKIETPLESIKVAKFECKAPLSKLRLLGEYMKSQGIEYKNIE